MAADEIKSEWTADFSDVNAALQETAQAGDDAFKSMMDAALAAGESITASQEAVAESVKHTSESVHEEGVNIGETLESMKASFETLKEVTGFAFLYEGLKQIGEEIERVTERAVQFSNLSDMLGITTTQYQSMAAAAEEAGVSQQVLDRASTRLVMMLQQARDGSAAAQDKLNDLGITSDKFMNETYGLVDALGVIKERLNDSTTAHAEHNAVMEAFSIRGALAAQAIKLLATSEEEQAEKAKELGFLTKEEIGQLKQMHVEYETLKTQSENMWEGFITWTVRAQNAFLDFVQDVHDFNWDDITGEKTKAALGSVEDALGGMGDDWGPDKKIADDNAVGDNKKRLTKEQLTAEQETIAATRAGSEERLAALKKYAADVAATYTSNVAMVAHANAQVKAEDRALNDARKKFFEEAATFAQEEELKIHDDKVKIRSDETKLIQADLAESTADLKQSVEDQLTTQLNAAAQASQEIKAAYADHALSARAAYTQETELAKQKLDAEIQAAAMIRTLGDGDAKAEEDAARREVKAHQEFDMAILKSKKDLSKRILQDWAGVTNALKSSLSSALSGMLQGTMSFGDAMRNIMRSVLDAIIQKFVEWGVQQLAQLVLVRTETAVAAAGQVSSNAAVAATAAMASVAAIPFYGWAMAPEVGAETAAMAMSYEGLASAAGGMQVPEDMLAMVHKDERVLPAQYSKGLDAMVNSFAQNNSSAGGGGGGGKGYAINAVEADSQHYFVKKSDLVGLIQDANHRFQFGARR